MWLILVVVMMVGVARGAERRITEEECEDAEFHLDPDDCPASYFRCTPDGRVGPGIKE